MKKISLCLCVILLIFNANQTIATKEIIINHTFLHEHKTAFKVFIKSTELQCNIVKNIPCLTYVANFLGNLTSYAKVLKNVQEINYLDRFFAQKNKYDEIIDKLENQVYQKDVTVHLSAIFKKLNAQTDQTREKLIEITHEQNVKLLQEPKGTTREQLREKVSQVDENGKPKISDEKYFKSTLSILLSVYIYEKNLHK